MIIVTDTSNALTQHVASHEPVAKHLADARNVSEVLQGFALLREQREQQCRRLRWRRRVDTSGPRIQRKKSRYASTSDGWQHHQGVRVLEQLLTDVESRERISCAVPMTVFQQTFSTEALLEQEPNKCRRPPHHTETNKGSYDQVSDHAEFMANAGRGHRNFVQQQDLCFPKHHRRTHAVQEQSFCAHVSQKFADGRHVQFLSKDSQERLWQTLISCS